jgi:hypothetical protein
MRPTLALALLLLPATAFAQTAVGPTTPLPVQKCMSTSTGFACTPVEDGAGFVASDGFHRVKPEQITGVGQQARVGQIDQAPYTTG